MGKHQITGHYTKAKSDSRIDDFGLNATGANMWALGYSYDLSKRTSVGVTYARIKNSAERVVQLLYRDLAWRWSGWRTAGRRSAHFRHDDPPRVLS